MGRHDPRTSTAFKQEWKDRGWGVSTAKGEHAPKSLSSDFPRPRQRHRQGAGGLSKKRPALVHESVQRMLVFEEANGKPRRELLSIQTEDLVSLALRNTIKMDMLAASPVRPFLNVSALSFFSLLIFKTQNAGRPKGALSHLSRRQDKETAKGRKIQHSECLPSRIVWWRSGWH